MVQGGININLLIILLSVYSLSTIGLLAVLVNRVSEIRNQNAELFMYYGEEEYDSLSDVYETTSPDEERIQEHVLKREAEFDKRIAELNKELDSQVADVRGGEPAEVLHRNVENLPHDSIKHTPTNPPDEYSI